MVVARTTIGLTHVAERFPAEDFAHHGVEGRRLIARPRIILARAQVELVELLRPLVLEQRILQASRAIATVKEDAEGMFEKAGAAAGAAADSQSAVLLKTSRHGVRRVK